MRRAGLRGSMSFRMKWVVGSLVAGAIVVAVDVIIGAPGIVIVSDGAYFFTLGPLSILYSAGLDWLERLDRRSGGSVSVGILVVSGLSMILLPMIAAGFACVVLVACFGMLTLKAPGWLMTRPVRVKRSESKEEQERDRRFAAVAAEQRRQLQGDDTRQS